MANARAGLTKMRGAGGRLLAYMMVAVLLLAGLGATNVTQANASAQNTVVGQVQWNGADLSAKGVWISNAAGQVASSGSGTGSTPIQMRNLQNTGNFGINNLAVSASKTHPGIYFTQYLYLLNSSSSPSAAVKARWPEVTRTESILWAPRDGTSFVEVEIPIVSGFAGETCGMEVNPATNELVISNGCALTNNTNFMVFNPGADGDPTTVYDNTYRLIQGSGSPSFSGLTSDMSIDAQGNLYGINTSTTGNGTIYRYDYQTGSARSIGTYTPEVTVSANWSKFALGFLDGKIIDINTDNGTSGEGLSVGINPLTLKSSLMLGTGFAGKGLSGVRYDGAGTEGAVALQGYVKNVVTGAGLADQTVAIYRSNGDGTATLVASRVTGSDGFYATLLDSTSNDFYVRVVQPKLVTSTQTKNGEVVSIDSSFPVGADVTSSTISSVGGDNGISPSLGTINSTKITVNSINDLVTFSVKDAMMVGEVNFNVKLEGSTADLANNSLLTTTATSGYGPQHINVDDQLRLGATTGSYLVGSTANDHATDDGVTAVIGGVDAPLNGQTFVVGGKYTLRANSQGSQADQAKVRGWVTAPSTTATVGAWTAEIPPMAANGASVELDYVVPGTTAGSSTLRIDSSLSEIVSPSNTKGGYAATATTADTLPWTTIGEVEDYAVKSATAIVRVKAKGASGASAYTLTGSGVTPTADSLSGNAMSATVHTATGGNVVVKATTLPAGQELIGANLINSMTGVSMVAGGFDSSTSSVTVPATLGTDTIVEFVYSTTPDYSKSSFTVSTTANVVANGTDFQTVTVTLIDKNGAAVTGRADQLTAAATTLGTGTAGTFTETGAGTGVYTAKVTSTLAGSKPVTVTFDKTTPKTVTAAGNANAVFVAGGVDLSKSKFDVSTGNRVADNVETHTITVTLVDSSGNFVSGQAGKLFGTVPGIGTGAVSAFTESSGTYVATVKSTVSGTKTATVVYDGATAVPVNTNDKADFIPGAVDKTVSTYEVSSAKVEADGVATATVTVVLKDAFGNIVPGKALGITGTSTETLGSGSISTFTENPTNYTAVIKSTIIGDKNITVSYSPGGTLTAGTNTVAYFISTKPSLGNAATWFNVTTSANPVTADGVGTHRIAVSLADTNSNPVTLSAADLAKLVGTSADLGTGTVSAFTAVAGTPGLYEATITSTNPGIKTVAVKYDNGTVNLQTGGSNKATFVTGGVDPDKSSYSVSTGDKKVTETHLVTVILADGKGNPVAGQAGSLFGAATGGATVGVFTETSTAGTYTALVSSTTTGDKNVTVNYGSGGSAVALSAKGANTVAKFIVGDPSFGNGLSGFVVSTDTRVANGSDSHEITVTLVDAYKNPAGGLASKLSAVTPGNLGAGSISGFVETATGSGVYKALVKSTKTGTFGFTVTYVPTTGASTVLNSTGNSFAIFVNGDPSTSLSNYTVTTGTAQVVVGQHKITVTLIDQYGNAVVLDAVGLAKLSATATLPAGVAIAPFSADAAAGVYNAFVTSSTVGDKTIAAFFDFDGAGSASPVAINLLSGGNKIASFIAGGVSVNHAETWFTVSKPDGSVGSVTVGTNQKITVKLVDDNGVPVSGITTGLTASALPNAGVTFGSAFTEIGSTGVYEGTVTSSVPGEKTISVSLGASSVTVRSAAAALGVGNNKAAFVADGISAGTSSFTVSTGSISVLENHTVTVILKDKFGNALSGKSAVLTAAGSPSGAAFSQFSETGTAGTYEARISSTVPATYVISVKAESGTITLPLANGGNQNAVFITGGPVANTSTYTVSTGSKTVDENHTITVNLRDTNGNATAIGGSVLSASADKSLGYGVISGFTATGTLGEYTAQITSSKSDTFAISVNLGGKSVPLVGNGNAVFVAGTIDAGVSTFTVPNVLDVLVGSGNSHAVDVYLMDRYGNPVEDGTANPSSLVASTTNALGNGSFSTFTKVSGKGHYQATVWSTVSGGKTVVVRYGTLAVTPLGNNIARFKADAVSFLPQFTNFTVSTGDKLISETHEVTVVLGDQYGNRISGMANSLTSATVDSLGTGSVSAFTENQGTEPGTYRATISSSVVGLKTMTAKLNSQNISVSPTLPNSKASFTTTGVNLDNVNTGYSVSTGDKKVTETHLVTVTLADDGGNPVAGQAGSLLGAATGGATVGVFTETSTAGTYTAAVSSTTTGDKNITVNYSGKAVTARNGANTVAKFIPGDPSFGNGLSGFVVSTDTRVANGSDSHEITVTLVDAYKNPAGGLASKLSAVTPGNLGAGSISGFVETATGSGVYKALVKSTKTGTFGFTVTYVPTTGASTVLNSTGNSFAIFVNGDPSTSLSNYTVTTGTAQVVVGQHKITVTLIDQYGNAVVLDAVGLAKLSATATLPAGVAIAPFSADAAAGVYNAFVTSSTVGDKTIAAFFDFDGAGSASPVAINLLSGGNKIASFIAGGVSVNHAETWFTVSKPDGSVGSVTVGTNQKITVKLVDDNGVPVSGITTGLTASALPNAGVTFGSAFTEIGSTGVYEGTVTSSVPGEKTISVSLGASSVTVRSAAAALGVGNNKAAFVADGISAGTSSFTVSTGSISVLENHTVTVILKDKFGNALSGKSAVLTAAGSPSGAAFSQFSETGTAGTYEARISSTVPATYVISVKAESGTITLPLANGGNQNAVFITGGPVANTSTYTVSTGSKTVDENHTITVNLRDTNGNATAIGGSVLSASADKSLGYGVISGFTATGTLGEYTAQITSSKSDTFAISVNLGGKSVPLVGNGNAVFVAGTIDAGVSTFTVPNVLDVLVGSGNSHAVDVYLMDRYGNPVEDGTANPSSLVASTTNALGNGSFSTFTKVSGKGHYQATVWSTVSGGKTVVVRYGTLAVTPLGNNIARFKADAVSFLPQFTNFTVSTGDKLISETHEVTVVLGDQYGNRISGMANSLTSATVDSLGTGSVSAFTENQGTEPGTYRATISSSVVGLKTMTAKLNSQNISVSPTLPNSKASFTTTGVNLDNVNTGYSVSTGDKKVTETHLVTVTLADDGGNPVAGQAGSLLGAATGGATVGVFTETSTAGTYTAAVSSTTTGDKNITVNYSGKAVTARNGANTVAKFIPGDPSFGNGLSGFVVSTDTRVANGSDSHEITVTLVDAYKNPAGGLASKLSAVTPGNLGAGSISGFVETATGSGVYKALVKSTKTGTFGFTVTYVPTTGASTVLNSTGNSFAIFVNGDPSTSLSNYTVTTGTYKIGVAHKATVTLIDQYGNAVVLDAVGVAKLSATANPSTGVTIGGFSATAIPGTYEALVNSTVAGDKTIAAFFDFDGAGSASPVAINLLSGGNKIASFSPDGPAVSHVETWFTVSTGTKTVGQTHTISVKLVDANGNLVSGVANTLSAVADPSAGITIDPIFVPTGPGTYETTITSSTPGTKTVSVSYGTDSVKMRTAASTLGLGNNKAVFVADAVSAAKSSFMVSGGANSVTDYHTVTAVLQDKYGNPLSGMSSSLVAAATPTGATFGPFTETATAGTYTAQIRSNVANVYTVTLSADSKALSATNGQDTAKFVIGEISAADSTFVVTTGEVPVTGSHMITVTIRDAKGNVIVNEPASINLLATVLPNNLGYGGINTWKPVYDDVTLKFTGQYSAQVTSSNTGVFTLAVAMGGTALKAATNDKAIFVAGAVTASKSEYVVTSNTITVGAGNYHTIDVYLKDVYGNPVEDGTASAAKLSAATVDDLGIGDFSTFTKMADKGHFQATVWSTKAGNKTVTVTYDGKSLTSTGNPIARFQADVINFEVKNTNFTVTTGDKTVDETHVVTVVLKDRYGNPVSGKSGQLKGSATDLGIGGYVGDFTEDVQVAPGVYTALVTATKVGKKTVTVTVSGTDIAMQTGGNNIASFIPSVVDPNSSKTTYKVTDDERAIDMYHEVTVNLADSKGNGVSGQADALKAVATNGATVGPFVPTATAGEYVARVYADAIGDKTVTVTYTFDGVTTSLNAHGANVIARFVSGKVDPSNPNTAFSVSTGERVADGTAYHEITATLVDAKGNPVIGAASKLKADPTVANVLGTGSVGAFQETSVPGQYIARVVSSKSGDVAFKVTLVDGGVTQSINAAANANWIAIFVSGGVVFDKDKTNFSVSSGTATVGLGEHKVTVRLHDALGNAVVLSSAQLKTLVGYANPADGVTVYAFSATAVPGVYEAQISSQKSGTKVITVVLGATSVLANGNDKATWASDSVDPNAYETWFDVTTGDQAVRYGRHTVTVQLVDRRENPVTGQADSLSGVAVPGTGVTVGAFTEVSEGIYEASIKSDASGAKRIKIYHGGSQIYVRSNVATLGIGNDLAHFVAGSVDPAESSFTVSAGEVSVEGGKHEVRVTLMDAWDNPVEGAADRLYASNPASILNIQPFVETSPGYYTALVSSEIVGKFVVNVKVDGSTTISVAVGGNKYAAFKNGGASIANSTYTVSTGNKIVGVGGHTITVTLKDKFGNPVTDGLDSLSARVPATQPLGSGQIGDFSQVLADDGRGTGVYTAIITSTKSGGKTVTALIGGNEVTMQVGGNSTANFIAAGLSDEYSYYAVTSGSRLADGTDSHTVTMTLNDRFSNGITGQASVLAATTQPDDTLRNFVFVESAAVPGQYDATIRSRTTGDKTVYTTVDGRIISTHGNNRTARFVAGAPDVATSEFQVSAGSVEANGKATHTVTVTLRDSNNNLVILPRTEVALIQVKPKGNLSLGAGKVSVLQSQGDGTYTATITSTIASDIPMWVSLYGADIAFINNGTASFSSNDWNVNSPETYFDVTKPSNVADGLKTATITVHLADAFDNAVNLPSDKLSTIVATTKDDLGSGVISGFTALGNGTYTATVSSTVMGVKTIAVSVGTTALTVKANAKATFVAGPADFAAAGTGYIVTTGPANVETGRHTVTVVVTDSAGNRVDVANVSKFVAVSNHDLGTGKITAFTRSELGIYTATVTSSQNGEMQITVKYDGKEVISRGNKIALFVGQTSTQDPGAVVISGPKVVGSALTGTLVTSTWENGTSCTYQWQSNGVDIPGATELKYLIEGKYVKSSITLKALCTNPNYTEATEATSNSLGPIQPLVTRIGGENRYKTSALVNDRFTQEGGVLFIATGTVYADALSAGPAVAISDGQLMLTSKDSLDTDIKREISDMNPSKIYIMGQQNSVSVAVENELKKTGVSVTRIGGADRYETSYLIYKQFFGSTSDAYLATGREFADALVASSAGGYLGAPVILVDGKSSSVLDMKVRNLMLERGVTNVHIAGGVNSVNNKISVDADQYFFVSREAGSDRYETAIEINKVFTGGYFDHVWVATGKGFADALSGAVPAGTFGEPIYLSQPECLPTKVASAINGFKYGERIIIGGTTTLNDTVLYMAKACS